MQYCFTSLFLKPSLQATCQINYDYSNHKFKFKLWHVNAGSAEILNIARSAGPLQIFGSNSLRKLSFWRNFAISKCHAFHFNVTCHAPYCHVTCHAPHCNVTCHAPNFQASFEVLDDIQTLSNKFSGSSPVQNLKLHYLNWGWTRRNSNLLVESWEIAFFDKFSY